MKIIIILTFLLIVKAPGEEEWRIKERENEAVQLKLWEGNLEKSETLEGHEKVAFLALGLKSMDYRKTRPNHSYRVEEIYNQMQSAALATSGYAEYYRDRIIEARKKLDAANGITERAEAQTALRSIQSEGFGTLRYLPSVETVRVLGDFLSDDRGPPEPTHGSSPDERELAKLEWPNSLSAAMALQGLPLTFKPVKQVSPYPFPIENVHQWQLWYAQVKAGTRTFRFEGDPHEYNLQGPVDPAKTAITNRPVKHGGSSNVSAEAEKPGWFPWAGLLAACVFVAAAVWYFPRGRKTA